MKKYYFKNVQLIRYISTIYDPFLVIFIKYFLCYVCNNIYNVLTN